MSLSFSCRGRPAEHPPSPSIEDSIPEGKPPEQQKTWRTPGVSAFFIESISTTPDSSIAAGGYFTKRTKSKPTCGKKRDFENNRDNWKRCAGGATSPSPASFSPQKTALLQIVELRKAFETLVKCEAVNFKLHAIRIGHTAENGKISYAGFSRLFKSHIYSVFTFNAYHMSVQMSRINLGVAAISEADEKFGIYSDFSELRLKLMCVHFSQ